MHKTNDICIIHYSDATTGKFVMKFSSHTVNTTSAEGEDNAGLPGRLILMQATTSPCVFLYLARS